MNLSSCQTIWKSCWQTLDGEVFLEGQVETVQTDGAEMRSPGADNTASDDPETGEPGTNNPDADKWPIRKRHWLQRNG